MARRNTKTGDVQEQMVIPALTLGGYRSCREVKVGPRLGGGIHRIDVLAVRGDGAPILVSLKWQQVKGTTEQKIPYEVMCLAHTLRTSNGAFESAYLVLGGDGWTLRDFYLGGGLNDHLADAELVNIVNLERFIALSNQGRL